MSDLRRQLNAARNERDQLRRHVKNLEAILGDIDPAYAQAYADLCDLALHGIRRPDDLGTARQHPESRPPRYHPAAYHYRNEERRDQRHRAQRLNGIIAALTDDLILEAPAS